MITPEMRMQMRRLVLAEKLPIETVARRFGVHHSTVRRALADATQSEQPASTSIIEPFKPYIVERLTALPELTAARLILELRDRGYKHGIAVLRRYIAKVRQPRSRKVYLRFETDPGEQAQVDWGHFGHMCVGGAQRPVSAFSMVLSWSRAIFVDFCFDQQMETFCRMHRRALEYFGGVTRKIVYDNLKSVVLNRVGSVIQFNPRFLAFAGHYVFEPTAAPVRYPEYKGRVEASIKYIRHSFFYGRSFASLEDLRAQAGKWRDEIANQRLHGTTRERPADRLLVERLRLRALPPHPFDTDIVIPVIVSKEARVRLDSNSYSVPFRLVGKSVHIRADDHKVRIMLDGVEVAAHSRCWDRRRHVQDPAHWFLVMWGIFTLFMFLGTLRASRALQFVFFSLTVLFFLLAIRDFGKSPTVGAIAGWEGILCGSSAIYLAMAEVLSEQFGRDVLPIGKPKTVAISSVPSSLPTVASGTG